MQLPHSLKIEIYYTKKTILS